MSNALKGLRVLNTRPEAQAQELSHRIQAAGGHCITLPTVQIKATNPDWLSLLPDLNTVHSAIFISANAVHFCFKLLAQSMQQWPESINVVAIGKATAEALLNYQINRADTPAVPDSEHLLKLDCLQNITNQTVLLFKGVGGRSLISDTLRQCGAQLVSLDVYERTMPQIEISKVNSIWQNDLVDIILITSEESLHNLFKMFGTEATPWLLSKTYLVLSERLAQSTALFGVAHIITSQSEELINTLSRINL